MQARSHRIGAIVVCSGLVACPPSSQTSESGDPTTTETNCEPGYCYCESLVELEPVPAACADLEVTPFEGRQLSAWMADPYTVMATTHETYQCLDPGFSLGDLECACVGVVIVHRYSFASTALEVGETTVTIVAANASLTDDCAPEYSHASPDGVEDFPVQILAVSDTCIVGETLGWEYNMRFYVDRQACMG